MRAGTAYQIIQVHLKSRAFWMIAECIACWQTTVILVRPDMTVLQVKFLKAVPECARPLYLNFAFPNGALLPTGIKVSEDLDLSWHSENQELFTALSSSEICPRTPGEASAAWQETIERAGPASSGKKRKSLIAVILWKCFDLRCLRKRYGNILSQFRWSSNSANITVLLSGGYVLRRGE